MSISLADQETQSESKAQQDLITPEPAGMGRTEIENLAEEVANFLDYSPGESDLPDLIESIGGKIRYLGYEEWSNNDMNFIHIKSPGDFTIQLLSVDGPNQHNFTLAHEIAHYIIHSESGEIHPMKLKHAGEDRVEWEANIFALSFLMPEAIFRKACEELKSVQALAGRFMVSFSAVRARKKILGIQTT